MRKKSSIVLGIILLAIAVFLVLGGLNVIALPAAFGEIGFGGIVVTIIMIIILVNCIPKKWWVGIFFPIAIICIVFEKPLHIEEITPWIVLLVAFIASIAFHLLIPNKYRGTDDKFSHSNYGPGRHPEPEVEESIDENGGIHQSVKFSQAMKYVRSQNFNYADLTSEFGELKVYFENVSVPNGVARINVKVSFGSMQLFIPRNWEIIRSVNTFAGNVDEFEGAYGENIVQVEINGNVSFGNLRITRI